MFSDKTKYSVAESKLLDIISVIMWAGKRLQLYSGKFREMNEKQLKHFIVICFCVRLVLFT